MTEQGYMQLSNAVIDDLMSKVSGNAFKVFMAIYRKTKGYNKASDTIPMSQLHELTGIKDKHTLIAAIDDLEVNGFIKVERKLGRTNLFQISNQCEKSTLVSEDHTSEENPHGVVGKIHTRTSGENPHPSKDNTKDNIQKTNIFRDAQKKTEPKPKAFDPKKIELPENVSLENWTAFIDMRNQIKKPVTQHAANLLLKKLKGFGLQANAVLDQSIENCWQGLFQLKQTNQVATFKTNQVQQTPRFGDLLKDKTIRDVTPPKKSSEVRYVC